MGNLATEEERCQISRRLRRLSLSHGSPASSKSQDMAWEHYARLRLKSSMWNDGQELLDFRVAGLASNYILNPPSKCMAGRDLGC